MQMLHRRCALVGKDSRVLSRSGTCSSMPAAGISNAVSSRFSCRRLTEGSCASRRNGADGLRRSLGLARLLPLLQVGDLGERLAGVDLAAQAVLLLEHVHGAVGELHGLFLGEY